MTIGSITVAVREWLERRSALREVTRRRRDDAPLNNRIVDNKLEEARIAIERGDKDDAMRLWRVAIERDVARVRASEDGLKTAIGLGLFDEAERLMIEGMRASPRNGFFWVGYARVAQERRRFGEASTRWEHVRQKFPRHSAGYSGGAFCLRELGRFEDADAVLNKAMHRFPKDIHLRIEHARLATYRNDWSEAAKRWTTILEQYRHPAGASGKAMALAQLGLFDEAEQVLNVARTEFPLDVGIAVQSAKLAMSRGNTEAALQRWEAVRRRFRLDPVGYMEGAKALAAAGKYEEAEAVLSDAIDRFRDNASPRVDYAWLAHRRGEWREAAKRWAAVRIAFPEVRDAEQREAEAVKALSAANGMDAPSAPG